MYRFLLRPKWIAFHLLVLAGMATMVTAARWQWTKYNQRDDFVTLVEARQDPAKTPPTELTALLEQPVADIEYRVATATGSYLADAQLIQILRSQDGQNGVNVLTAFQIDDGPIVLVNRGFVPDGTPVEPPPTGTIRIGGTVRTSQPRRTGELTDNNSGVSTEVRRVDLPVIAERLGLTIAPVYLEFINSEPAPPATPIPLPEPDLTGGPPHLSYTVQWILFTIAVAVGWVLAVRRSIRTRRKQLAVDVSGAAPPTLPSA